MNIDILTASLVNKGFTETRAKSYAREVYKVSKENNISIHELLEYVSNDIKLNELGSVLLNSALRFGYKTGTMDARKPNKYIARAIIK